MAMIRMMAIVMIVAAAVACGDAADGESNNGDTGNNSDVETCTGEDLKLNYRACEGEDAWNSKLNEAEAEYNRRNIEHVDPTTDDYVLGCPGSPEPDTVAHHCNYDPSADADRCTWRLTTYQGGDGAMPMPYCSCRDNVVDSDEAHCD